MESEPFIVGTQYEAPITIASDTVIIAAAFAPGKNDSPITVATYTIEQNPIKYIFSTKYKATIINWILFFVCFGWIWMWF